MLQEIGFTNIIVDMSSSQMRFEVDVQGSKKFVQIGPRTFNDPLYGFEDQVNSVIARVTILADKPSNNSVKSNK